MTFLPIVARELRVASRKRGTFWVRTGAAFAVVVTGTWCFLILQDRPASEVSEVLFGFMIGSAGPFALYCGALFTADCLSQEKREGTLGLLFLTDLRGYDVVLGKLTASSVNALYSVLALVPVLAVPLLMGGVTPAEFCRMAIVVLNALFFSLTAGICVSALSRSPRKAALGTVALIVFFSCVLPLGAAWLEALGRRGWLQSSLLLPSPGTCFVVAFDAFYKIRPGLFWWSLGTVHVLGWVFLVLASVLVPRSWQDKPAGVQGLRWQEQWRAWSFGDTFERQAFRARLLEENPFYWLAARVRLRPACVWAVLGLVACAWIWGLNRLHREWLNPAVYFITALFLNALLKCWVAAESGRQLAEDRQQGSLELLLSTSLAVPDILRGQFLALQRQFLGPLVVSLSLFLIFMLATMSDASTEGDRVLWAWLYVAGMLMLVADLAALYWLGMWRSLTARNPQRALLGSAVRIFVLPWLGVALGLLAAVYAGNAFQYEPSPLLFVTLWLCGGLTVDIGFGAWARHKLLAEFRLAASERYVAPAGWWKKFLLGSQPPPLALNRR